MVYGKPLQYTTFSREAVEQMIEKTSLNEREKNIRFKLLNHFGTIEYNAWFKNFLLDVRHSKILFKTKSRFFFDTVQQRFQSDLHQLLKDTGFAFVLEHNQSFEHEKLFHAEVEQMIKKTSKSKQERTIHFKLLNHFGAINYYAWFVNFILDIRDSKIILKTKNRFFFNTVQQRFRSELDQLFRDVDFTLLLEP